MGVWSVKSALRWWLWVLAATALTSASACTDDPDPDVGQDAGRGGDAGSADAGGSDHGASDRTAADLAADDALQPDTALQDGAQRDATAADAADAADVTDAAAPDAADPCQLPAATVFSPANGSELVLHGAINAQGRSITVVASDLTQGNALLARTWDGTSWSEHEAMPSYTVTPSPYTAPRVTEQGGQALIAFYAEDPASGAYGHYVQQVPSGAFAPAALIPDFAGVFPTATQHFPVDDVLLVGGISDYSWDTLTVGERAADGSWSVSSYAPVYNANTVGVGRLANGNVWAATTEYLGGAINLFEREVASWSLLSELVPSTPGETLQLAHVAGPPRGATGKGLVLWQLSDLSLQGAQWNVATGVADAPTELLAAAGELEGAQVLYDQDNIGATFILFAPADGLVWLGRSESTRLGLFEPLRDDLVFEDAPVLFWSGCGELMIVHHSRTLTQPAHSQAIVAEPLESFRTR